MRSKFLTLTLLLHCIVTVTVNFTEALRKFDMSFDAVLTDIGFPDGFDIVKHIH